MKVRSVVQPIRNEIVIEGITFFLEDNESYVAIDEDGSVYAYCYMPKYFGAVGVWQPCYEDNARYIGSVELEIGDSFDKVYRV